MPVALSAASAAMHGAMVPIGQVVVSGTSTFTITFSSIPQVYQNLRLVGSARTSFNNLSESLSVYFNGDNSSGLYSNTSIVTADAIYNGRNTNVNQSTFCQVISNTAATGAFNVVETEFLSYSNTSINKIGISKHAADYNNSGSGAVGMYAILWRNTNAITSISIQSNNGAYFIAGTTFTLYGVRSVGQ